MYGNTGNEGLPFGVTGSSGASGVPGTSPNSSGGYSSPDIIPGSALYAQAAAAAQEAYAKALANINNQRHTALSQFGYMGTVDPKTGVIRDMKVDPNNPYGMYQTMLYNHGVAQEQARNAADARGLGHVGLGAQGVAQDQRSFGADSANLSQNLMGQLEGFQSEQDQAYEEEQNALWQAELSAAELAIQQGNFTPADVSSLDQPNATMSGGSLTPLSGNRSKNIFTAATRPTSVRVSANKTGASRNKRQGIFSIH